jgi:hypothetical protein
VERFLIIIATVSLIDMFLSVMLLIMVSRIISTGRPAAISTSNPPPTIDRPTSAIYLTEDHERKISDRIKGLNDAQDESVW